MAKRALITGVNGQDGAYLAKFLLDKNYAVVGAVRRTSSKNIRRLAELGIADDVELCDIELLEFDNILRTIQHAKPDEIYNLAAQSFVAMSFEEPIYTGAVDALGATRILEAIRRFNKSIRYYQASTSEMFGRAQESPQSETTPFYPRSPYAVAKLYAHWMTVTYRESYNLFAASGILFNHESPLRGQEFVTRKVTLGLARIKHGELGVLEIGKLDSKRDRGFAGDYVEGMWHMLQQERPDDYVLATGETHSVRDFVVMAGKCLGFDIEWQGSGDEECGIDRKSGRVIVKVNPRFYRPAEVDVLCGNPGKAERLLGWQRKISFSELVATMAESDDRRVRDKQVAI
jgi:GDPmannose 4,6-dehydratase